MIATAFGFIQMTQRPFCFKFMPNASCLRPVHGCSFVSPDPGARNTAYAARWNIGFCEALGVVRQACSVLEGGDEYGLAQTFGTESPFFFRQECRAYVC